LDAIINSNLILLNNGTITRVNRKNPANSSAIDLTLSSAVLHSVATWDVDEDDIGSDHRCIKIEFKFNDKTEKSSKRILNIQNAINDINLIDLDRLDNLDNLIASVTNELKKNANPV
jgi:hypothetical protein